MSSRSILVKVKGYPSWPGMVVAENDIPARLLDAENKKKKSNSNYNMNSPETHYCVKFYNDNNYIWLKKKFSPATGAELPLKDQFDVLGDVVEIEAFIAKEQGKRKKNEKLIKGFQMAIEQVNGTLDIGAFMKEGEPVPPPPPPPAPTPVEKEDKDEKEGSQEEASARKRVRQKEPAGKVVKKQDTKSKAGKDFVFVHSVNEESPVVKSKPQKKSSATPPTSSGKKEAPKKEAPKKEAPKKETPKKVFKFESATVAGTDIPMYELISRGEQMLDILEIKPAAIIGSLPDYNTLLGKKAKLQDTLQSLKDQLHEFLGEYVALKKKKKAALLSSGTSDGTETVVLVEFTESLDELKDAVLAELGNLKKNTALLNLFSYIVLQDDQLYHYFQTYVNVLKLTKDSSASEAQQIFNKLYTV